MRKERDITWTIMSKSSEKTEHYYVVKILKEDTIVSFNFNQLNFKKTLVIFFTFFNVVMDVRTK